MTKQADPTVATYAPLQKAHQFFNAELFGGILPHCLLTLRVIANSYGFFTPGKFDEIDGGDEADQIAMNPKHFDRPLSATLATLVHESVHQQHHHFGITKSRGYHNREWAELMKAVGLHPSSTGAPGGRETGARVSHYIIPRGRFERACDKLVASGWRLAWKEKPTAARGSGGGKTKFTCPNGCGENAWGKPSLRVDCHVCTAARGRQVPMVATL